MSAPQGFDEAAWQRYLAARRRRLDAMEAGASEATGSAVFSEHFVAKIERETSGEAKVEVAALLGSLRLEQGRGK